MCKPVQYQKFAGGVCPDGWKMITAPEECAIAAVDPLVGMKRCVGCKEGENDWNDFRNDRPGGCRAKPDYTNEQTCCAHFNHNFTPANPNDTGSTNPNYWKIVCKKPQ
tara:strand:+ start:664 stop:987 length:324 start_codon:yes stop_codon:yes gene_type:complete